MVVSVGAAEALEGVIDGDGDCLVEVESEEEEAITISTLF